MWHLVMLEFEIPASATKWKIDLSKIPERECSPEPATGTVADVPDVTDLADKTGSEFAIQGNCIYTHKFSGSVSGLKGDLKLASTDDQTLTVSAQGEDTTFEFQIHSMKNSDESRDLTEEEITEYNSQTNFDTSLLYGGNEVKGYFAVSVSENPTGQTCVITNGSKNYENVRYRWVHDILRGDLDEWYYVGGGIPQKTALTPSEDAVSIVCTDNPPVTENYTVGGTVSGLSGTVKLKNYATNELLNVSANGNFVFTQKVNSGDQLDVRAIVHPNGQYCVLTNDFGTVTANVTDVTVTCGTAKRIFASDTTTGDMDDGSGGIVGADSLCMSSTGKPYDGTWKALIAGSTRTACTTADCSSDMGVDASWVLAANTKYFTAGENKVIGTTNANGIFTFPLTNGLVNAAGFYYTGLSADWTTSANTCSDWSDEMTNSSVGTPGSVTSAAISNGMSDQCAVPMNFVLCVEQ